MYPRRVDLTEAFLAAAPPPARLASEALARALAGLVDRGSRAWPRYPVDPAELVRHAAERLPPSTEADKVAQAIESLHAEDLHLAVACVRGAAPALEEFDRRYLSAGALRAALSRIDPSNAFADEVRQILREKLFIGAAGKVPRIAEYSGRGALGSWVRVVALRAALDLRPSAARSSSDEPAQDVAAATVEPELRFLKERYGKPFEQAVSAAFASLDDEQCNLLRLQLVDGLRTAQIAALFNVDRSTIKRRLASCREHLLEQTRKSLMERLGISPTEFESLAGLVQSQLNVSIERLLKRG
jgi:RNA polymerase sigma-70 factor (ECF subfamily)